MPDPRSIVTLEIGVDKVGDTARVRASARGGGQETESAEDIPLAALIDCARAASPGAALGECVLRGGIRDDLQRAVGAARAAEKTLRIRLKIAPSLIEVHQLPWEALEDRPGNALGQVHCVTRYAVGGRVRDLTRRQTDSRRALVFAPLPEFEGRSLVATRQAADQHASALRDWLFDKVGDDEPATLARLAERMAVPGGVNVAYLVCHGSFSAKSNTSVLWFADEDGNPRREEAVAIQQTFAALENPPDLVVFAACMSAAGRDPLGAIAPSIARAGVPAVVGMNGAIPLDTLAKWLAAFSHSVNEDGDVEMAMLAARKACAGSAGWWFPILYSRLADGRIWAARGFDASSEDLRTAMRQNLAGERLLPVLGPALSPHVGEIRRHIARDWAERVGFPMSTQRWTDFSEVAQYLSVRIQSNTPRLWLIEDTYTRVAKLAESISGFDKPTLKPIEMEAKDDAAPLQALVSAVGRHLRGEAKKNGHPTAYTLLAQLPFPVYFTADTTDLLVDALREEGKDPVVRVARWNERALARDEALEEAREKADKAAGRDSPEALEPTPERPFVCKLFGDLAVPTTLVLTQDQYLDYLLNLARGLKKGNSRLRVIPDELGMRLTTNALLLVGFEVESWEFRVLLKCLIAVRGDYLKGARTVELVRSVSAQLDPDASVDPNLTRIYLAQHLSQNLGRADLYWGTPLEFLAELARDYAKHAGGG